MRVNRIIIDVDSEHRARILNKIRKYIGKDSSVVGVYPRWDEREDLKAKADLEKKHELSHVDSSSDRSDSRTHRTS